MSSESDLKELYMTVTAALVTASAVIALVTYYTNTALFNPVALTFTTIVAILYGYVMPTIICKRRKRVSKVKSDAVLPSI